jgi:outer membrane receptor protein involved in Fe transport
MIGLWLRRGALAPIALAIGIEISIALPLEAHAQEPEATSPPPAPAPAEIIPPRLLGEAIVEYPDGASGEAEVVLELLISAAGEVGEASVVSGPEPFGAAARARALGWRFEPARQGGVARAARIRFLVRFVPPAPEEPPIPALGEEAPAEASSAAPARPAIEVTVLGARNEPRAQTLTRAEVRQLPGAFGDPFRAIEALPGVTPLASGVPFFYVRGAPPGNVGYFLDGIRLPLLYHVGLGPSVVHPALVSRVDLYPGAYPTRYGRFSGGIVAGEVEAPLDRWHGEWQIRLFDTGVMTEAPFADGRGHVLLGGRYSYTAYLISLLGEEVRLEYWDYQLRAGYRLGDADELSVFAFGSFDYFGEDTSDPDDSLFSTEFHRIDLRHDHEFSPTSRLRSAVTWGFDRTRVAEDTGYALDRRLQLRSAFDSQLGPGVRLSAGVDVATDAYSIEPNLEDDEGEELTLDPSAPPDSGGPPPGVFVDDEPDIDADEELARLFPSRRDWVAGAYVEVGLDFAGFVHLEPGLRFDTYRSQGASALSFEPRISAEFRVTRELTLKNAIGLAAQPPSFVVPVAGFEIGGLPGGLQRSVQSSAGVEYRLPDQMKLSLSLFHNAFFNMTDILSLARIQNAEEELRLDTRARGQAYGLELMLHRDLTRRFGGFLSYTLSRSSRLTQYGRIAAAFDRTHVLNAVAAYDIGRRWRAGGRFVFYTGTPELLELGGTSTESRLPPFYRLDVRIEKRWPFGSKGGFWALVFEVLNTTLNREVVARSCGEDGDCDDEAIGPVVIPSIGIEGRF